MCSCQKTTERCTICGTLRLRSGERVKPGGDLSFRLVGGIIRKGPWLPGGFLREESYARVWQGRVALCVLPEVAAWEEHSTWFDVTDGLVMQAAWSLGERGLRIVTRPPNTLLEQATHHRHPLLVRA